MTRLLMIALALLLLFASFEARPVQAQSGFTYDCSGGSGTTTNYFQYDFSIAETYAYGSWSNSGGTIGYSAGVGKTLTGSINNYLRYNITSWPSAPDIYQVTYTVSTNGNWGRLLIKPSPYWDNWADNLASGTRTSSAFSAGTFVTASPIFEADLRGATSLTFQSLKIVFRGACPYDPTPPTPTPTPIPSATPIIIDTFATPTAIAINAPGLYDALGESNDSIAGLPPDLSTAGGANVPAEDGSEIFGYVKWLVSPSSADELAGPFAPIVSHTGIFISATIVLAVVYAVVYAAVYLLKFIIWIFKFILLIVDLVLQVAQAIGQFIGGIVRFFF